MGFRGETVMLRNSEEPVQIDFRNVSADMQGPLSLIALACLPEETELTKFHN